jgi:hypothetical protein
VASRRICRTEDFGGFPVSTPDGVRLLPMAWARDAKRLAEDGYMPPRATAQ